MKDPRAEVPARPLLAAFCATTSLYCLLCALPFSWNNFLRDGRYPLWVGLFLRGHGALALALVLLGASALRGRARAAWTAVWGAAAAWAAATGWLAGRGPGGADFALACAAWLPYLSWEAAFRPAEAPVPGEAAAGPRPGATVAAALACAAAYAAASPSAGGGPVWPRAAAAAWGALATLELFLAVALLLDAARAAAAVLPAPRRTERALTRLLLWAAAARGLAWVLASLSFRGPAAWGYAALSAGAVLLASSRARASRRGAGALSRTLGPLTAAARAAAATPARRALTLAALAAAPWAARAAIGGLDWNKLLETLAAVAVWAFAAAFFSAWPAREVPEARARRRLWTAAAAVLALAWGARAAATAGSAALRLRGAAPGRAVLAREAVDVSLSAATRILTPARGDADFFAYLQSRTNLPRDPGRGVRDLELVKSWGPGLARKPDVFIIVVDSLRPDYLGAYDPKVRFTPALDAFAKDAVVFRRAFAAYGGTGLSEPSIWAGARLPHMQYPEPFSPMNALEKLVDRDGYRPLITMDVLLTELLKPDKRAGALDRETRGNYKLCGTLKELEGRLGPETADGRPLFVYTQPQDIHISVIQREGARPVSASPDFDGFYAPYASRVARLDACFGGFVSALKRKGLYDDSIIVVTADHGDSLGEDGRWGHAYTIYPEVLRVPLIVKVPKRLLDGKVWEPGAAAFLTDLTPSLYALLGREPDRTGEPFGRSLFEPSRARLDALARPERVEASSYGPVYGLLSRDGGRLYIADAVNDAEHLFDLDADPAGRRPLSDPAEEARDRAEIRRQEELLQQFYGD
jgi:hypothetical protein